MILSPEMQAFDLMREPKKMREAYGHSDFASGCLLARRLVEAGVTFVEVNCRGWDTHQDNFLKNRELAAQVDQPTAALIKDLKQRGLLDSTLVVWMGEFGRTPKINSKGGRDHWGNLCPLVFVGGGLKMGQVIGESDKKGAEPITNPITSNDLLGTIMHSLFDLGKVRTLANIPRDVQDVVGSGNAISELI